MDLYQFNNINNDYNNNNNNYDNDNNTNNNDIESSNDNVNELFEILSNKIKNMEIIDEILIIEITNRLKLIRKNHNNKILTWYDEQFYNDLDNFKKNSVDFYKLMNFYQKNSYVLINNEK